jgi:hypothetical protein
MALTAAEAVNGGPLTLYSFQWDLGGNVVIWQGGALDKVPGGCILRLDFGSSPGSTETEDEKVSGDGEFASNSPEMRAVAPKVETILIRYSKD